jgi:diacylglycerol kinase family enzyme
MRHIFIINPAAGQKNVTNRARAEREGVCARRGIAPLIFISEYNGYERFIAEKMCSLFTDEDIRFYCIGGSGTLTQTLSGMDDEPNRQIACYPTGLSNDFLKCYKDGNRGFRNIENLLDGRVDELDYIKVVGSCKALDFVNIGIGNSIFETESLFSLISETSSTAAYGLGVSYDLLRNVDTNYEISIDGTDYSGHYAMVLCMNGRVLGNRITVSDETYPDDGIMNIFLFHQMHSTKAAETYMKLYFGKNADIQDRYTMVKGRRMIITRKDHERFSLNVDGEGFAPEETTLDIRLIPSGVKFVAPQHTALLEPEDAEK